MTTSPRHQAMVDFLGTFPTVSGAPPQSLEELSDGVVLFEVLSEMYVLTVKRLLDGCLLVEFVLFVCWPSCVRLLQARSIW